MSASHDSCEDLARDRRGSDGYRQGCAEAQRAFLIGSAIRQRRQALGLSQTELARRARRLTQSTTHIAPRSRGRSRRWQGESSRRLGGT